MLVLSNDDVERVLTMSEAIDVLRQAYRDLAEGRAINRPRTDLLVPGPQPDSFYAFKSMEGIVMGDGVAALRINSDVVHWPERAGVLRREKIPTAPGRRWVGLVQLFSLRDGRLSAIFPDGVLQGMRVGATNGLAADYLARPDATQVGILGAGWQAGAQAMAICAVRPVENIRVYSPTPANREAFAEEWAEKLGVTVEPVAAPEAAVRGADVVMCATNALAPIFFEEWLDQGMHITCVRDHEIHVDAYRGFDLVVVNALGEQPTHRVLGAEPENLPEIKHGWGVLAGSLPWSEYAPLSEVVSGRRPGRSGDHQKTCFSNNLGLGVQFAAMGARVLKRAGELGLGHELPDDWFTQDVHP